ncbi:hypothetical protein C1646_771925 [Rhizophagus diaphanus]|nr:hypothetical protein C1646_771925 [Rhizophagus diaphanus] [Rhizophagus sp. MUCL 43196]
MSCSKIFSGNFPELTYEIIKYFQNDFLTLHSCILVNRLWCRLATPLLWENPFSVCTENYDNYIEIYLQYLNDDFKTKLKEYNIINNSLLSNTLFNYSSFLKYLNINKLIFSVINWLEAAIGDSDLVSDFIRLASDICNTNFIHNNIRNLNFYIGYYKENKLLNNRILPIIKLHQNLKKVSLDHDKEREELSELQLLIQKSCDYLENFGYDYGLIYPPGLITGIPQGMYQLLDLIVIHCKNIKFLDLDISDNRIYFPVLKLIEDIKHNLNYLSINIYDINRDVNSFIIQRLGEIIPFKLEYLHLYLHYIKAYDFEVFLKSSQDTFIKKLLINNFTEGQDILPSIKTYIMKKRRVKYLAINGAFFKSKFVSDELFSLKDEVKEFMLYDIKVQSYHDLMINLYDYMKEVLVLFTEKNDIKSSQKKEKENKKENGVSFVITVKELQVVPTNEKPPPNSVIQGQPERYIPERILRIDAGLS